MAGTVEHSIIGQNCVIEAGAVVRNSVLLDDVHVGPTVELINVVADSGADITGGSQRGSAQHVTVIDRTGTVSQREAFDTSAVLPRNHEQY